MTVVAPFYNAVIVYCEVARVCDDVSIAAATMLYYNPKRPKELRIRFGPHIDCG